MLPPNQRLLPETTPRPKGARATVALGVVVGLVLGVSGLGVLTWMSGCGSEAPRDPPGHA